MRLHLCSIFITFEFKFPVNHVLFLLSIPILAYLDLLSSDGLQLSLLSNGEGVYEDLSASCDRHFEVVACLLDLRDALDVFAFLDELIRET